MHQEYIPDRALFIYAHPDDIEFSVAGTAAKWARYGSDIMYVVITDGNVGSHEKGMTRESVAAMRRQEQTNAAAVAGVEKCEFLGYHDGLLEPSLALRKDLVRYIRIHRPNVVVTGDPTRFFPSDSYINHPDHRAAAVAAIDAVFPAAEMNLLYPDFFEEGLLGHKPNFVLISHAQEPNFYVDITETIEIKIEALRQHVSQLGEWDPEPRIREWSATVGKQVGFRHAEAYRRITLRELPSDEEE